MKNTYIKFSVIFLLFVVSSSCRKEKDEPLGDEVIEKSTVPQNSNLNVSIFLDLSDRIDPLKYPNSTMEYFERDLEYINSVTNSFVNHVRRKKTRQINDNIALYFNPEPKNPEINVLSSQLKFKFDKNNSTKELISSVSPVYNEKATKIYDLTIKDNSYPGSDIWKFFENDVKDYCISANHRNILVILTDGYMYHEDTKIKSGNLSSYILPEMIRKSGLNTSDWMSKFTQNNYGFIPINQDFSNLEILVLGINPDTKNPYEGKVIVEYWSKWFKDMKVQPQHYEIKETSLPSNMNDFINKFIAG